ncbi:hypothetical protein PSHT_01178 [Puccinia striiformis]|uniref:Uncharacterized protein n=1 Tax=Puccinia striiformis TaxID=27350 RepID=A0A2S4WL05_9BASI|nr:hypothetical protein PSHT_01178 [Puccinia striiformis]
MRLPDDITMPSFTCPSQSDPWTNPNRDPHQPTEFVASSSVSSSKPPSQAHKLNFNEKLSPCAPRPPPCAAHELRENTGKKLLTQSHLFKWRHVWIATTIDRRTKAVAESTKIFPFYILLDTVCVCVGLLLLSLATTIITESIASSEPPLSSPPTHSSSSPAIQAQSTSLPRPKLNQNFSDLSPAHYRCLPISPCQPCPIDQLANPICSVYHNRRLMECIFTGNTSTPTTTSSSRFNSRDQPSSSSSSGHPNQDRKAIDVPQFQTWQACERIVSKERQDFYEFFRWFLWSFMALELTTRIKQYGKLAARIGILPS